VRCERSINHPLLASVIRAMTTDQLNAMMLATLLAQVPVYAFMLWPVGKSKRRS